MGVASFLFLFCSIDRGDRLTNDNTSFSVPRKTESALVKAMCVFVRFVALTRWPKTVRQSFGDVKTVRLCVKKMFVRVLDLDTVHVGSREPCLARSRSVWRYCGRLFAAVRVFASGRFSPALHCSGAESIFFTGRTVWFDDLV